MPEKPAASISRGVYIDVHIDVCTCKDKCFYEKYFYDIQVHIDLGIGVYIDVHIDVCTLTINTWLLCIYSLPEREEVKVTRILMYMNISTNVYEHYYVYELYHIH